MLITNSLVCEAKSRDITLIFLPVLGVLVGYLARNQSVPENNPNQDNLKMQGSDNLTCPYFLVNEHTRRKAEHQNGQCAHHHAGEHDVVPEKMKISKSWFFVPWFRASGQKHFTS